MTTKFCVNCVHFTPDKELWTQEKHQNEWGFCSRTNTTNPVTGKVEFEQGLARSERRLSKLEAWVIGACGKSGRYYEEKTVENTPA